MIMNIKISVHQKYYSVDHRKNPFQLLYDQPFSRYYPKERMGHFLKGPLADRIFLQKYLVTCQGEMTIFWSLF